MILKSYLILKTPDFASILNNLIHIIELRKKLKCLVYLRCVNRAWSYQQINDSHILDPVSTLVFSQVFLDISNYYRCQRK